jgi:hypothetical protein
MEVDIANANRIYLDISCDFTLHNVFFIRNHYNSNGISNLALEMGMAIYNQNYQEEPERNTVKAKYSDIFRESYKGYAEPILLTAATHQGSKRKISRSKYIRYALINQLIRDGYPLKDISSKFNGFYRALST